MVLAEPGPSWLDRLAAGEVGAVKAGDEWVTWERGPDGEIVEVDRG